MEKCERAFKRLILGGIFLIFSACGAPAVPKAPASSEGAIYDFYLVQFNPSSGQVADLPSEVSLVFNRVELNFSSVFPLTHYNILCGSYVLSATQVEANPGSGVVTVTLPDLSSFPAGTSCTLVVSGNLQTTSGQNLEGPRKATYVLR